MIGRHRTTKMEGDSEQEMRQDGDKGNERKETGRRRLAKEAYFIDIVFFFSPTRVFEQTLAPIRIAGLEQLDGPSTYRHAVQQQCSRCVLCLSWSVLSWAGLGGAGAGTSRRSRKRRLDRPCSMSVASVVGPAQALNVGRPKRGRRRRQDQKRRRGRKKRVAGGVGVGSGCDETTRSKKKNGKKATSE